MSERILEKLEPVRRRQLGLEVLRSRRDGPAGRFARGQSGWGCAAGKGPAYGAAAGRLWAAWHRCWRARCSGAIVGPGCAADRPGWRPRRVDRHYGLKDRAVSAVDFIRRGQPTPIHALQVADAEQHLAGLDPRQVAPFRVPGGDAVRAGRDWRSHSGSCSGRGPGSSRPEPPEPLEAVLAAAEEAEESLEDLEEAAKKENDPKLKELVQKLTESIQEMKLPGVDTKEALAKLSEMQAAIAAQQAQFNVGLVDAQMQALGEALASTQSLEGAGQSLQHGKYDKAAEQLEQAEPKFDRKEAKTLKEKLAKAAKEMEEAGLADLSTATTELAESLEDEGSRQGASRSWATWPAARAAASGSTTCSRFSTRTSANARATATRTARPSSGCARSRRSPSSNWGMGISGNTDGDKTKLDSARKREQVQGQMGEGVRRPRRPTCPKAGKPPRGPTASNIRSIAA